MGFPKHKREHIINAKKGLRKKTMQTTLKGKKILDIELDPRIKTTYDITTEESAKTGDYAESGWEDEVGVSMRPDKYDIEDGITTVDKAVEFLKDHWTTESNINGTSYYNPDSEVNYQTGEYTNYGYHLHGFTKAQIKQISDRMDKWKHRK
jgi:hypothetical protein